MMSNNEMALAARRRPANYANLSGEQQWMIDKELGILDWDGTGDAEAVLDKSVGVYLTPGQIADSEAKMRERVHELSEAVLSAASSIVWAKTRNPAFKAAESMLLIAIRALHEADVILNPKTQG